MTWTSTRRDRINERLRSECAGTVANIDKREGVQISSSFVYDIFFP